MKQHLKQAGQVAFGVVFAFGLIFALSGVIQAGSYRPAVGQTATATVVAIASPTATVSYPIFAAPVPAKVTSVSFTPQTAVTGDTTNTVHLNVLNAGAAGSGTTEVGNLDLITSTDLVAFNDTNIPFNATYLSPGVNLAEGDVLVLQRAKVGNALDMPLLNVRVEWVPR